MGECFFKSCLERVLPSRSKHHHMCCRKAPGSDKGMNDHERARCIGSSFALAQESGSCLFKHATGECQQCSSLHYGGADMSTRTAKCRQTCSSRTSNKIDRQLDPLLASLPTTLHLCMLEHHPGIYVIYAIRKDSNVDSSNPSHRMHVPQGDCSRTDPVDTREGNRARIPCIAGSYPEQISAT